MDYLPNIITFLGHKLGVSGTILGTLFAGFLIALCVFIIVGGNFDMLRNNKDIHGKSHPWKNTIIYSVIFLLATPIVIIAAFFVYGYGEDIIANLPQWGSHIFAIFFFTILIVSISYLIIVESRR
jgi:hypothetical protein